MLLYLEGKGKGKETLLFHESPRKYYSASLWLPSAMPTFGMGSVTVTATAKSLQPCPTLCDPIDGSPPGSAVPGILQARILECVALSFFNS